jgi:small subunit ribosomal protein S8
MFDRTAQDREPNIGVLTLAWKLIAANPATAEKERLVRGVFFYRIGKDAAQEGRLYEEAFALFHLPRAEIEDLYQKYLASLGITGQASRVLPSYISRSQSQSTDSDAPVGKQILEGLQTLGSRSAVQVSTLLRALEHRWYSLHDRDDLDACLALAYLILEQAENSEDEVSKLLEIASTLLFERWKLELQISDLDVAISLGGAAIEASPADSLDLPRRLRAVAISLLEHWRLGQDRDDLSQCLILSRECLRLTSPGMWERASSLDVYVSALVEAWHLDHGRQDLELAVVLAHEVLRVTSPQEPEYEYRASMCAVLDHELAAARGDDHLVSGEVAPASSSRRRSGPRVSDPIADMLTRIRNANVAMHDTVRMPSSRLKESLAAVLAAEGYIESFRVQDKTLEITISDAKGRARTISGLRRVSKPGLRVYTSADKLPRVLGGLGVAVLSTSQGLMTDREARRRGVGGEVLCYVW